MFGLGDCETDQVIRKSKGQKDRIWSCVWQTWNFFSPQIIFTTAGHYGLWLLCFMDKTL